MTRGRPPYDDVLTPAEWRVVEAVRHGLSNAKIAQKLGVSSDAVKYHVANVFQKLGLSNRSQLRRWDGVRQDSGLAKKEQHVDANFAVGPIAQLARTVSDIAAARRWYQDVLGLEHLYSFGDYAFFDCGGVRLFLSPGAAGEPQSLIYFRVDDIRAACSALTARGVKFISAPHLVHRHADGAEEWLAIFDDNEGRPLAIMALVRP